MSKPFFLNLPPVSVTLSTHPTTNELAGKSNNPFTKYRYSADGRKLITDLNGQAFQLQHVRRSLCDIYPDGVNADVDSSKEAGTDGTHFGHPEQ